MAPHINLLLLLSLGLMGCSLGQKKTSRRREPSSERLSLPHLENYPGTGSQQPRPFQHRARPIEVDSDEARRVPPTPVPILKLLKQQSLDGSYKSSYETGNSIIAEETGFVKNPGVPEQEIQVQYGSYSYTDPDGRLVSVTYTADEGGFRPVGDHLPTPPPVSPEVQRGLDIIFESIRQEAEKEAHEQSLKNTKLESQNFPADIKTHRRA